MWAMRSRRGGARSQPAPELGVDADAPEQEQGLDADERTTAQAPGHHPGAPVPPSWTPAVANKHVLFIPNRKVSSFSTSTGDCDSDTPNAV